MNTNEAQLISGFMSKIANQCIEDIDKLLIDDAGYESKMNFFMAFMAMLIQARAGSLEEHGETSDNLMKHPRIIRIIDAEILNAQGGADFNSIAGSVMWDIFVKRLQNMKRDILNELLNG